MLKTNSKEVIKRIKDFIFSEAAANANDNGETIPDYLRRIYTQAQKRTKGTNETPAQNIVNSCTCFFYGDFDIFNIVQSWTGSAYEPTETNINKALKLYYNLLDREIQKIIK